MNTASIITVQSVTKAYKLYERPSDRLKEVLNPLKKSYHREFYAIRDVSFKVNRNECLAIIGKNGSGKSTMLKMITGILNPTKGVISVDGKVSALLELGAGFNPELTGLENIYLNGTLNGLTRDQISEKLDEILAFADIGDFIHQPVKIYSSGMFVRLAFAVAISVDPDILIVDEALSVGDIRFQQKCYRKIEEFKRSKTVLFVSHDLVAVTNYCDRAIWIDEGSIQAEGDPNEVVKIFQAHMIDSSLTKSIPNITAGMVQTHGEKATVLDPIAHNLDILGDGKVNIKRISLFDHLNSKTSVYSPGHEMRMGLEIECRESIEEPIIGFTIKDRLGTIIAQTNTYALDQHVPPFVPGRLYQFRFAFPLPLLNQGQYTLSPAVASGTQLEHIQHCWIHDALVFTILDNKRSPLEGFLSLKNVEFHFMNGGQS
ncbi:ABC transporter ATP-binding protein [Gorillibacterium sp. sgz500922]|uniref:ABC transporter ATP-binding protein n=1 Tax=Gorillibacterium sp. sgz500922 TaxID=3446694 RepID=UPI003F662177